MDMQSIHYIDVLVAEFVMSWHSGNARITTVSLNTPSPR